MSILEKIIPGEEVTYSPWGKAYVISNDLQIYDADAERLERMILSGLERINHENKLSSLNISSDISLSDMIFLDLETCGLGSQPIFLCGILIEEDRHLLIRQFLARDYSEEAAILAMVLLMLETRKLLITYNGKSFDLPYLLRRSNVNDIPTGKRPYHLDMLPIARHHWGRHLPNCQLQTLESLLLNRHREDDIPGSQIPTAYHRFVSSGNAEDMVRIVYHNGLDLLTLAELTARYLSS